MGRREIEFIYLSGQKCAHEVCGKQAVGGAHLVNESQLYISGKLVGRNGGGAWPEK